MKLARAIMAGCLFAAAGSMAWAEEPQTGRVMQIDRLSGTVTIEQAQGGTVGSSAAKVEQQYKVESGLLENVHAEDNIKFFVSDVGGKKTITKIESK